VLHAAAAADLRVVDQWHSAGRAFVAVASRAAPASWSTETERAS
jgi:hypothetical protein